MNERYTEKQIAKVAATWTKVAGSGVIVKQIGLSLYGFTGESDNGELAAYRLWKYYGFSNTKARASYSTNEQTWYFALDTYNNSNIL